MISLIVLILLFFIAVWFFVWFWFFKHDKISLARLNKIVNNAIKKNDYQKAEEVLSEILNIEPSLDSKCKLGLVQFNLKKYDAAKLTLEEVLKASPKHFDALFVMAQTLQAQKKNDEALEYYKKALTEKDKSVECYINISCIYYEQKNYNAAIEILEKAKEISPNDARVLFYIAKCKMALLDIENADDYTQMVTEYIKLLGQKNLPKEFDTSLAELYAKNGQPDKAYDYCKKAIENNGEDIEAYILLGLIQLIRKEYDEAKNTLSIALNLQSNNPETHKLFSYLLCSNQQDCTLKRCRQKYYELVKKHLKQ